jgi:hypothetical protein
MRTRKKLQTAIAADSDMARTIAITSFRFDPTVAMSVRAAKAGTADGGVPADASFDATAEFGGVGWVVGGLEGTAGAAAMSGVAGPVA